MENNNQSQNQTISQEMNNIIPPQPPRAEDEIQRSNNRLDIGDGKFSYISNKYEKEMLINGWQAVTQLEAWNHLLNLKGSIIFSQDPMINRIYSKMEQLGYSGHSGTSFACTIRNLQYLAKQGEPEFIRTWDKP
jgi:hypothetical protein